MNCGQHDMDKTSFSKWLCLTLIVIALLVATYAAVLGTLNFYNAQSPHNQLKEKITSLMMTMQQHAAQLHSLQATVTTIQKNQQIAAQQSSVNTQQLFSEIANINTQIQTLSLLPKGPDASLQNAVNATDLHNTSWHERLLEVLKQFKSLFVIRHIDQNVAPFISSDTETIMKLTMSMQLSMAQWALLRNDNVVYQSSLQTVVNCLTQYFALANETNAIIIKMHALQKNVIAVSPSAISNASATNANSDN